MNTNRPPESRVVAPRVVIGAGLVTPRGPTLEENVFYMRAGVRVPGASPFVDPDDESIRVSYCPWLGARAAWTDRVVSLASAAIAPALEALQRRSVATPASVPRTLAVFVVTPPEGAIPLDRIVASIRAAAPSLTAAAPVVLTGAAAAFEAFDRAGQALAGQAFAALVVSVDSYVEVARLEKHLAIGTSHWSAGPLPPSEAAAAVALVTPQTARTLGLEVLGELLHSATTVGTSGDDDDEPIDGAAITSLLHGLPILPGPIVASFGQSGVDSLRALEWSFSAARARQKFSPFYAKLSPENAFGLLGAAAGLANVAMAIGSARHHAFSIHSGEAGAVVAWAISPDRLRGLGVLGFSAPSFEGSAAGGGFDGA